MFPAKVGAYEKQIMTWTYSSSISLAILQIDAVSESQTTHTKEVTTLELMREQKAS